MAANTVTTTDPGVTNDSSQGFAAGSTWRNLTNGKLWVCSDATIGAAVWTTAASSGPANLTNAQGAAIGDNTLVHPLRTQSVDDADMLTQILLELRVIRVILADALKIDLLPEDVA